MAKLYLYQHGMHSSLNCYYQSFLVNLEEDTLVYSLFLSIYQPLNWQLPLLQMVQSASLNGSAPNLVIVQHNSDGILHYKHAFNAQV